MSENAGLGQQAHHFGRRYLKSLRFFIEKPGQFPIQK